MARFFNAWSKIEGIIDAICWSPPSAAQPGWNPAAIRITNLTRPPSASPRREPRGGKAVYNSYSQCDFIFARALRGDSIEDGRGFFYWRGLIYTSDC